ncbi:MAG: hypothetical protein AABM41_05325 [Chloroflexota bacterium]
MTEVQVEKVETGILGLQAFAEGGRKLLNYPFALTVIRRVFCMGRGI